MTETREIKVGAVVTMRGTIIAIADRSYKVRFRGGAAEWLEQSDFLSVENPPEPLKVGDRVKDKRHGRHGLVYTILGVHDQTAWIITDEGSYGMPPLSDLERVTS